MFTSGVQRINKAHGRQNYRLKRSRAWRCPRCHDFTAILIATSKHYKHFRGHYGCSYLPCISLGWISSRTVVLPAGSGFQLVHTFNSHLFSRSEWRFWYTLPVRILVTHFFDTCFRRYIVVYTASVFHTALVLPYFIRHLQCITKHQSRKSTVTTDQCKTPYRTP
jgi:hypothetical protein